MADPHPLSAAALAELRDAMHLPECGFAASSSELDAWLAQLDAAIDAGELDPRPSWVIEAEAEARRVAEIVAARLAPATRAEFITAGNAVAVTGQDWRWVIAEAQRLGVPVGGTGKKRIVDLTAFRAALEAEARPKLGACDDTDAVDALRRKLGYTRRNGHA